MGCELAWHFQRILSHQDGVRDFAEVSYVSVPLSNLNVGAKLMDPS